MAKTTRHHIITGFFDFMLLTVALFGVQLIKRGSFELSDVYINLFVIFVLAWLSVSLFMRKFSRISGRTFPQSIVLITKSNIAILYIVSFSIVLWAHMTTVSRMQTFGVCGFFLLLELVSLYLYYILSGRKIEKPPASIRKKAPTSSSIYPPLPLIDALLLITIFLGVNN